MSPRDSSGLDLAAILRVHERARGGGLELPEVPRRMEAPAGLFKLALKTRSIATPLDAAEAVRAELSSRNHLDEEEQQLAIAADLITGHVVQAGGRIAQLSAAARIDLERFLVTVWGVGRAPRPAGFDRARGREEVLEDRTSGGHGVAWLYAILQRRWQAWRVVSAADRQHFGSATVVNGAWIGPRFAERTLVLTCSHVCTRRKAAPGEPEPILPEEAALDWHSETESWTDGAGPRMAQVKDLIWESPPDKLDAVLLEVERLPAEARPPAAVPAKEIGAAARIYIWGYPESKPVWLSNEDNDVQEVKAPYFYYDAFAEAGSSGSPVFDVETHDLVGMHRGENRETGRRQAVVFELVLRAARKQLSNA